MIEFDPAKDKANIAKHGVSLALAVRIDVEKAIIVQDRRHDYGEVRLFAFGHIDGKLFALTFTDRRGTIRAISRRRADTREVQRWLRK